MSPYWNSASWFYLCEIINSTNLKMKKYISQIFLFVLTLTVMTSCTPGSSGAVLEEEYTEAKVNNKYSMMVPSYMSSTTELHDDASLQYMNESKEVYIIVIDEERDSIDAMLTDLQGLEVFEESRILVGQMMDLQMLNMRMSSTISGEEDEVKMKVGEFDAMRKQLIATVPGIDAEVGYFLTMVEGKNNVYTIMQWTLGSRMDKYQPEFEKMVDSFKEI